ncbi:MAG TPA: cysteine dioxygenase family protein [Polyangiaceae bacterium]|jgi:predicted metal-dependent enzyme (double-stranded beta helix superfamily)|nr:cysteine dioxygenase family protein [Polyangiaceae bacterium]
MRDFGHFLDWIERDDVQAFADAASMEADELSCFWPRCADAEPYGRRVLHTSSRGEVMLAGWRAGACSAPHDHGRAEGVVVVLQGRFVERAYACGEPPLVVASERELAAGDLIRVSPGIVHDMRSREAGLTLHLYAPGIEEMRVYDPVGRVTWRVSGTSGAWLPRVPEMIRERIPWS